MYTVANFILQDKSLIRESINKLPMDLYKTIQESSELTKLFSDNEKKYQAQLRDQYDIEKIFKNKNLVQNTEDNNDIKNNTNTLPAKIYNDNIFKRIIKRILNFFK